TMGRAARNVNGRVILYADQITGSLERAIGETDRRRAVQVAYNKKHKITPKTIEKRIHDIVGDIERTRKRAVSDLARMDVSLYGGDKAKLTREKRRQMHDAADRLDFETAALIRDELATLEGRKKQ
ncbi:MAG TPA: UvrB/UvrC motif-containing protein, partial [Candidatus Paceibacterota bacterium]|nr:UvrB/UvrC motif-containing protein [Candidatus Paceibacterota bacterium]